MKNPLIVGSGVSVPQPETPTVRLGVVLGSVAFLCALYCAMEFGPGMLYRRQEPPVPTTAAAIAAMPMRFEASPKRIKAQEGLIPHTANVSHTDPHRVVVKLNPIGMEGESPANLYTPGSRVSITFRDKDHLAPRTAIVVDWVSPDEISAISKRIRANDAAAPPRTGPYADDKGAEEPPTILEWWLYINQRLPVDKTLKELPQPLE